MPHKYAGRFVLIALVILGSLWAIFPNPLKLADRGIPWSQKMNLKPGIDMVGGSSLLYEIKPPPGATNTQNLVQQVMGPLKRRVDPEGVKNLVWRPQGDTRLEIQMPLLAGSEQAEEMRQALINAQRKLEETNITAAQVVAVVEGVGEYQDKNSQQRQQRLDELAMGSPTRVALFKELNDDYARLQDARARKDVAATVAAQDAYQAAQAKIEDTNLTPARLEQELAQSAAQRAKFLESQQEVARGFPARKQALDATVAAFDSFARVRNLVDNVADLKRKLKGAGVLEFHIAAVPPSMLRFHRTSNISDEEYQAAADRLLKRGPRPQAGEQTRWFEVDRPSQYVGQTQQYGDKHYMLMWVTGEKSMDSSHGRADWKLIDVRSQSRDNLNPELVVAFTFDPQGGRYFSELTGGNLNQPLGAILDGKIISVANIISRIGETGTISGGGEGGFTKTELDYLVNTLAAGSLPAQLAEEPISERTIGPQLGKDNLRLGLISCLFGVVVVAIFLIGYYYLAGSVAFIAVVLNLLMILGAMALLNATFTLPSIAGIVLTIGMAVDANVLIFERLREEQVRGLSLRMAMRNAYDKAWSAILDSNVTTAITAAVLYIFGSEEVKGFGLTLLIGIVSSLFTSLYVTKTIFGVLIDRWGVDKLGSLPLTFPKWDQLLRPNIDWMGKAKYFYAFSTIVIIIGLVAFAVRLGQGRMLDVEFTKGTSVQFELLSPMAQDDVRSLINTRAEQSPGELPSPSVVAVGADNKSYEVVTPNDNAVQVREAVLAAMRDPKNPSKTLLKLEELATFGHSGEELDAAEKAGVVIPIRSTSEKLGGFVPGALASHVGGVAIVLKDLTPPLPAGQINDRLDRQRLQLESRTGAGLRFDVVPGLEPGTAIVLASDPAFPYDSTDVYKQTQWTDEIAGPVWRLTNDAVNRPAGLQRISNFDAQVAGETKRDATIAMVVSVVGIMAYIWIRFGNLRYGSATVVALLHDTLFVLAAIGISHYMSEVAFLRHALLVEPFRINLTMIAAILTVMGWSMNDTVVVFDRIRENRGRYGAVSRSVINDSINQTLSRTLLTGSTTILTIFVMYVIGGPGIHGFTFSLLVGIVVGTYSSIAIASPILLLGASRRPMAASRPVGTLQRAGA